MQNLLWTKQKLQAYFISIKEVTTMMNNLTDEQLKN